MQAFQLITGAMDRFTALTTVLGNTLQTLASNFLGAGAPSSPAEGQLWSDSGTGYLQHYRNGTWHVLGDDTRWVLDSIGSPTANVIGPFPYRVDVVALVVVPLNNTTGSDGSNNWSVQVTNQQTFGTMFATQPSTNGNEWAIGTPWEQVPDQNQTVEIGQTLLVNLNQNGSPTAVPARISVQVRPRYE